MPLPDFNDKGDLPEGVHQATIDEVISRFGTGTPQRQLVTTNLLKILKLAVATGKLERLIIFGSYVTTKANPNDVDIILVFQDDFDYTACDEETRKLFSCPRSSKISH